ncbi:High-affinity zinc uptake system protein ZnuA precursor [Ruegeria denitrificans]|uniref:High-affinity zinc uptake system protein ZnuA n=1 Tax=Ruegeria denitrificans TaxID=1715692 RepID=A0A0P1IJC1_9RHOB|nr:zinc ABC transporter substrate-binding protein [Ruegeria denitrificans]CUK05485.1 High-affinity zinc uptake system protein ZnuA precursor [Ruegeria denitrificans]
MLRSALCVIGAGLAGQVAAEAPIVATDIAPVHSLVARVMVGVGEPDLIIPPVASPHNHAMRPSEARALQSAHVVFWVGEELTPWMVKPLSALSGDAQLVTLLDVDGTVLHDFRDVAEDDHHDHDDDHAKHDDHSEHADHDDHSSHVDHDDHAEDKHDDHADYEEHAEKDHAGHDDHGHDHDGIDPHAWLDPENARVWVQVIAETLAAADPDNAQQYRDNAQAADVELVELQAELIADLNGMQARRFITFHDAYQYFEKRFGLETSGSVSLGDASAPGPARLAAVQNKVTEDQIVCAFAEPQYDTRLVKTAIERTGATIYELDPIGVAINPGADQYTRLLRALVDGYQACAQGS